MATRLLDNIYWDINFPPRKRAVTQIPNGGQMAISKDQWRQVVLPARNFTLIYPVGRYGRHEITVPYGTDEQAITTEDILTTIYEFYQEPFPLVDINRFGYEEPPYSQGDALDDLHHLQGLLKTAPDTYYLQLSS